MRRYAAKTAVSTERSKGDIERLLTRYGADQFAAGWDATRATIMFRCHGKHVRFLLPLPDRGGPEYISTPVRGLQRKPSEAYKAWEQDCRQRWRALLLVIKAKLEAVEAHITTFEEEFLAHIVLQDGRSVGELILPQIAIAYRDGVHQPLLLE